MITAKTFNQNLNLWNEQLDRCINPNIFSLFEWGEYKKSSWSLERICFYNNETFVGQTQILFKKIGFFKFGWCSSGINVVDYCYLDEIIKSLSSYYDFRKTYIRFNFFDVASGETKFEFDLIKTLRSVSSPINSSYTVRFFNLSSTSKETSNYSKNNRYYLKKALAQDLKFSLSDMDIDLFCRIHNQMAESKELHNLKVTKEEMAKLQSHFKEKIKLATVLKNNEAVCAALLVQHKEIMYYMLAGSTEEGRKLCASFFMIDSILKYAKETGIKEFDFGGISPFKASVAGINRFKMGFGGNVVNYIGEKNVCDSNLLIRLFDFIISKKLG